MQPGWCQPVRQEFMENEREALPGVAYPGVRDNRTTINTKTRYDDDDEWRYTFLPAYPRSFVCLCARLHKNVCMDLDEMLRVDRCRDMDELINF